MTLQDLRTKCAEKGKELERMASASSSEFERIRLSGKAEGLRLAWSYIKDAQSYQDQNWEE